MASDTCYIAKCKHGNVVAAACHDDPKRSAKTVADWIKRGFSVSEMTLEQVRGGWCEICRKVKR